MNNTNETKWTAGTNGATDQRKNIYCGSATSPIAICDSPESAKQVAREHNERPELIALAQSVRALEQSTDGKGLLDLSSVQLRDVYDQARAVLNKAKEGK